MIATTACGLALVTLAPCQRAVAQSGTPALSSFQLLEGVTPFHFNVNGTDILPTGNANVGGLLNNSANTLSVGWKPPDINHAIEFKYAGTASLSAFGTTLITGDIVKVYAIGGVFLTNDSGFAKQSQHSGSLFTAWSGSPPAFPWTYVTNTDHGKLDYFGYTGGSGFGPAALAKDLAYTNTGSYTGASAFGTFQFGAISPPNQNTATYLGLDVLADVVHSNGATNILGQTGRIRVNGFSVAPEGSSLLLLAFGLTPVMGLVLLVRRRTTTPSS